jgi:dephospho-CoA kinase
MARKRKVSYSVEAMRIYKLALTGGIATGKSTARERFEELGIPTVDADDIARKLPRRHSEALEAIVRRFGPAILNRNGTLNRRALGAVVFANPDARLDLEAILHPAVYRAIQAWFEHLELLGRHRIGLADIPLLFETGRHAGFDKVIVTWCREDLQLERVIARGFNETEAQQRIAAQLPSDEKAKRADYVIDTSGPKEDTFRQIDAIFDKIVEIVQPEPAEAAAAPADAEARAKEAAEDAAEDDTEGSDVPSDYASFDAPKKSDESDDS